MGLEPHDTSPSDLASRPGQSCGRWGDLALRIRKVGRAKSKGPRGYGIF